MGQQNLQKAQTLESNGYALHRQVVGRQYWLQGSHAV